MKFETTRSEVIKKIDSFIEKKISEYNYKRNFDFGPSNRENVSCLSPFISHRTINEYEVAQKVLKKYSYQSVEKYVQEIFWRVYWKGWLELRPNVWEDFLADLKTMNDDEKILNAKNGKTNIKCFNDWVNELKSFNYLHNHTRMWFASIWIFTLKLPWQKGAEFFMEHLFDGDAASNTLSWRWVAGLQTKGKNYVAQSWNITKFTNNKYKDVNLEKDPLPLIDNRKYNIVPVNFLSKSDTNENLLFFDNNLELEHFNLEKYKKIYCVFINNNNRKIKLNEKVIGFKKKLIDDQKNRVNKFSIINDIDLITLTNTIKNFDVIYPCIGENMTFLRSISKKKDLNLNFILREEDRFSWQFSNKGYFNFKSNIPKILSKFKIN